MNKINELIELITTNKIQGAKEVNINDLLGQLEEVRQEQKDLLDDAAEAQEQLNNCVCNDEY